MKCDLRNKKSISISGMYDEGACLSLQRGEVPQKYMDEYNKIAEDFKRLVLKIK